MCVLWFFRVVFSLLSQMEINTEWGEMNDVNPKEERGETVILFAPSVNYDWTT